MLYIFTKSSKYCTLLINILLFMCLQYKHISHFCYYYIRSLAFINIVHFFVQLKQYQNGDLVNKLKSFWPNLKKGPNEGFWGKEYKKHGSCFFPKQVEYFLSTVRMMHQIPDLTQKLEDKGCILYLYII